PLSRGWAAASEGRAMTTVDAFLLTRVSGRVRYLGGQVNLQELYFSISCWSRLRPVGVSGNSSRETEWIMILVHFSWILMLGASVMMDWIALLIWGMYGRSASALQLLSVLRTICSRRLVSMWVTRTLSAALASF